MAATTTLSSAAKRYEQATNGTVPDNDETAWSDLVMQYRHAGCVDSLTKHRIWLHPLMKYIDVIQLFNYIDAALMRQIQERQFQKTEISAARIEHCVRTKQKSKRQQELWVWQRYRSEAGGGFGGSKMIRIHSESTKYFSQLEKNKNHRPMDSDLSLFWFELRTPILKTLATPI